MPDNLGNSGAGATPSNQQPKICNNPNPKNRILGFYNKYNLYDSCPPSGKDSVDTVISQKDFSNKRYHLNKTSFKIHRHLHFSKTCCLPSTSALLTTSVPKKLCLKGSPILSSLYNLKFHLSPEALTDLKWWANHLQYHSKTPFI